MANHGVDGRRTVYVVHPDAQMREMLRALLGELDCNVRLFPSAEEFLPALGAESASCVVTEVRLPGLGGLDLLERLEKRAPRLPVIVLTGPASVRTAVRAIEAGAAAFIEIPFLRRVLLNTIRRHLGSCS